MHVQTPPGPSAAEGRREDAHVAHAEHQLRAGVNQRPAHFLVEVVALTALTCFIRDKIYQKSTGGEQLLFSCKRHCTAVLGGFIMRHACT